MPKFLLLTALKEGYLLLANTYGFLVHPYLTLKKLRRDRSQMAVFGSLFLGGWLGVLGLLGIFGIVGKFFPSLVFFTKLGMWLAVGGAVFLLLFSFYLSYWIFVVWREK